MACVSSWTGSEVILHGAERLNASKMRKVRKLLFVNTSLDCLNNLRYFSLAKVEDAKKSHNSDIHIQ